MVVCLSTCKKSLDVKNSHTLFIKIKILSKHIFGNCICGIFCIHKFLFFIYSNMPSHSYTALRFAVLIKRVFPTPILYMLFSRFVCISLFNLSRLYFYIWHRIKYGLKWLPSFIFFQMNSWLCQQHLLNFKV